MPCLPGTPLCQAGPLSTATAWLLAVVVALWAVRMGWRLPAAFSRRLDDRWSALLGVGEMATLAALVAWWGPSELPWPLSPVVAAAALAGAAWPPLFSRWRRSHPAAAGPAKRGREGSRKAVHLLLGLVVVSYMGLGWWIMELYGLLPWQGEARQAFQLPTLWAGQVVALAALLVFVLLLAPIEVARLAGGPYVLQGFTERRLRPRERDLFGHHFYIVIAGAVALLWLGSTGTALGLHAAMAAIAITVFADAAGATAGTRWGRRRLPNNPGKSVVGSVAGTLVAATVAWPFVGLAGAAAGAALFLLTDVLAPLPVPLSDNLLNPVLLAALFEAWPTLVQPPIQW
ncbi:MAG: hypothetical protein ACYDBQ_06120 [Thermoplasmatota archaeon]